MVREPPFKMDALHQRIVAVVIAGVLNACASADDGPAAIQVVEVDEESAVGLSWEEYRRRNVIAREGGGFIVEWDLFFPTEEKVRAHYESELGRKKGKLAVFQRISNGFEPTFEGAAALDIKYCVSNSFTNKSAVVADMAAGTHDWQRVMNVRFRYVPGQDSLCSESNVNVDFAVMPFVDPDYAGCGASKLLWGNLGCAYAFFAVRGVLLLQYSMLGGGTTAIGLIRHELGHILGFRHEHPWSPGGGCTNEPPNEREYPTMPELDLTGRRLTPYDQTSVMHYPLPECGGISGTDYVISPWDGLGGRSVYGIPAAWFDVILN